MTIPPAAVDEIARIDERVVRRRLESGLAVLVLPKPGFMRRHATVTTRYGSIDSHFRTPEGEELQVPDGIAHFLEHQMFAKPYGDAFEKFSELGVSANAYTSYTTTTYLASTAKAFEPALDLLLDLVQEPYFTRAGVDKERGIIAQELRMYLDSPHWRLSQNLRECLFQRHPIRIDIGGTLESIAQIDEDLLLRCHRTFYHPSNMVVCVVGDVDADEVAERIQANLDRHGGYEPKGPIDRIMPEEPEAVARSRAEAAMTVARPLVSIGYKERGGPARGSGLVRRELLTAIAVEAALGKASPLYTRLYEAGLIGRSFGAGAVADETFGFLAVSAETDEPRRLEAELLEGLDRFREEGVSEADFERIRRRLTGDLITEFDSPDSLAHALADAHFAGVTLAEEFEILDRATVDDVNGRLAECLAPEAAAVSVVTPVH